MTAARDDDGTPFPVLVVCTGNICRSPAVEVRLRAALGSTADVNVSSAGVRALVGEPIDPAMARLLGDVPADIRGRQLTADLVRAAGVILTMSRDQRRMVVASVPAAVRRTFTLAEFAGLAAAGAEAGEARGAGSPGQAFAALVRAAPRYRGQLAGEEDIEDPYGRGPEVFRRVLARIDVAVGSVVRSVDTGSFRCGGESAGPIVTRCGE